nr:lipoate-protein ligase B [Chitinophagaceae bacterium]
MTSQQIVRWKDLGLQRYKPVWDYQEQLLQEATDIKRAEFELPAATRSTHHYLLLVEHPPVITVGRSGNEHDVKLREEMLL